MPSMTDKPDSPRAAGLLNTLRDVLFETTPNGPVEVSPKNTSSAAPGSADLEAARTALRQSVEAALGPGVQEFALQVEALREVLPDAGQRQRAALRVLALKSIPAPALVAELEQVIAQLSRQNEAFSAKLSARKTALEEQRSQAIESCRLETAQTEQTIARLQSELDAARTELAAADSRRTQALAVCDESAARLAQKRTSFERAFAELHAEYSNLQRQLANAE